jgi:hypothetical protein
VKRVKNDQKIKISGWALGALVITFAVLLGTVGVGHAANLITNPSFESGASGWDLQAGANTTISTAAARTGSKSLKLVNTGASKSNSAVHSFTSVKGGTEYVFSGWVKGVNVVGKHAGGKPLLLIQWYSSSGAKLGSNAYHWAPYGTYNWRQMLFNVQAPALAAKARVTLRSWYDCTSGHTYWDDISLAPRNLSYRGNLIGTYQAENANA